MSPLSSSSQEALARLRAFIPPPTIYPALPLGRRAAVLLLLFADRRGDLRVLLTVRSTNLRTFAGQVALPGGRADSTAETAVQTARREAYEEIGLPLGSLPFPQLFSVKPLTELPLSLAKGTCVRPCVAFLDDITEGQAVDAENCLAPKLDSKEVSSVFTVPLERFLLSQYVGEEVTDSVPWYSGSRLNWKGKQFMNHEFQVPVWHKASMLRYKVWGFTSRVLVETARIAFGRGPQFTFDTGIGDEELIRSLFEAGELSDKDTSESTARKAALGKGLGKL